MTAPLLLLRPAAILATTLWGWSCYSWAAVPLLVGVPSIYLLKRSGSTQSMAYLYSLQPPSPGDVFDDRSIQAPFVVRHGAFSLSYLPRNRRCASSNVRNCQGTQNGGCRRRRGQAGRC